MVKIYVLINFKYVNDITIIKIHIQFIENFKQLNMQFFMNTIGVQTWHPSKYFSNSIQII